MRIFVTGATGVVGRPLLPLLVGAGHQVVAVARSDERARGVAAAGAHPVRLRTYDAPSLAQAMTGCDVAVDLTTHVPPLHHAALRSAWREHDDLRDRGTAAVVAAAHQAGVRRVVRDSVAFLHADGGEDVVDESSPLDPGAHLASAVRAEEHVRGFSGEGVVLRFALLYGPASSYTRAAVTLGRRLRLSPVLGPDRAWAASLHTDDAAAAVLAALDVAPGTWDVGDDEPLRRADLVGAQAEAIGVRRLHRPPAWLPAGTTARALTRSHRLSAARFRAASGWRPAFPSAREGWVDAVRRLER